MLGFLDPDYHGIFADQSMAEPRIRIPQIELLQELGRGGFSVVYKGRRKNTTYAVKLPLGFDEEGPLDRQSIATRFRREAVALARVTHPNLMKVMEVGEVGDIPYLVMELAAGETLADRILSKVFTERETTALGVQVATALDAIHRAGLVHRDVKPQNIIFDASTGAARLVDFGFAVASDAQDASSAVGTREYSAPEQLSVFRTRIDGRADLFALGSVMVACLTGRPPDGDVDEQLRGSAVTPRLRELIRRLLERRPDDRFANARLVLRALDAACSSDDSAVAADAGRTPSLDDVCLVGRSVELNALRRAWDEAETMKSTLSVLRGSPGSGKTTVASGFLNEVRELGRPVLVARCPSDGTRPFFVIRQLIESYLDELPHVPARERVKRVAALRAAAGDLAPLVRVLSPRIGFLFDDTRTVPRTDDAGHVFVEGLSEFLRNFLSSLAPTMLFVDDTQWLDDGSRSVLKRTFASATESKVAILLATRTGDEFERSADELRDAAVGATLAEISLGPFTDIEVSELVTEYLGGGSVDADLHRCVRALSDGTPLAVLEVVRAMLDVGAVGPHWGVWRFYSERLTELPATGAVPDLLAGRITRLDRAAQAVLSIGAVAGDAFDDELVVKVSRLEASEVQATLANARRARLVEAIENGRHVFSHHRVREALLEAMGDLERRQTHQLIADAIDEEALDRDYVNSLIGRALLELDPEVGTEFEEKVHTRAFHYARGFTAENPERTFVSNLMAARLSFRSFDNSRAIASLEVAEKAHAQLADSIHPELSYLLGEAYLRVGSLELAKSRFEGFRQIEVDTITKAMVLSRIAWIELNFDADRSWIALCEALRVVGAKPPSDGIWPTLIALVGWVFHRAFGRLVPWSGDRWRAEMLATLYYQLARLSFQKAQPSIFVQVTLRSSRVADWLGPSDAMVKSLGLHAMLRCVLGRRDSARRYLSASDDVARELRDPALYAQALQMQAVVAIWNGDVPAALDAGARSLTEYGHWRELSDFCLTAYNQAQVESVRGRCREAWKWMERSIAKVAQHEGAPLVVEHVEACARGVLASLGRDADADALVSPLERTAVRAPAKGVQHISNYGARVRRFSETGDLGEEFEALVEEFRAEKFDPPRAHLEVHEYYVYAAHARLHACYRCDEQTRPTCLRLLEAAHDELRRAARIPLFDAHQLVIEAGLRFFESDRPAAEKLFAQAEALAQQEAAPWVLYAVHRGRAHLLQAAGQLDAARDQARMAEALAEEHGAVYRARWVREEFGLKPRRGARSDMVASSMSVTGLTGRRSRTRAYLRTLLRVGRAPVADLEPEHQARVVIDEIVRSLHAERGFIFLTSERIGLEPDAPQSDNDGRLKLLAGRALDGTDLDASADYDRDVIQGLLLAYADEDAADIDDGVAVARTERRSIIAATLMVRHRAIGIVYLDRRLPLGVFGGDDAEVLHALALQIPVALELARVLGERERAAEQLHQTQKLEAVERLAGGIGHDFNNLLATIRAAAEVLELDATEGEQLEDIRTIRSATVRAEDLTRQLLAFSKGQFSEPELVRVNDAARALRSILNQLVGDRITLETNLADDVPNVMVDPGQLDQVLTNLVINARDALPGGGKIVIRTARAVIKERSPNGLAAGVHVALSVADDGQGMPEDVRKRVFEPYFTTKIERGGTGLGLASVHGIITQAGGVIEVESQEGVGTTFTIHFPSADVSKVPTESRDARESLRGRETVLLVEDEPLVRRPLRRVLETYGYSVLTAASGEEALKIVEGHAESIDLLLSDVLIPGMNGLETARRVRELRPETKVLFMSGQAGGVLAERGILGKSVEFLQKPIHHEVLAEKIRKLLDGG